MPGVDLDVMAVEVESSHQYSTTFFCCVTDGSRGVSDKMHSCQTTKWAPQSSHLHRSADYDLQTVYRAEYQLQCIEIMVTVLEYHKVCLRYVPRTITQKEKEQLKMRAECSQPPVRNIVCVCRYLHPQKRGKKQTGVTHLFLLRISFFQFKTEKIK